MNEVHENQLSVAFTNISLKRPLGLKGATVNTYNLTLDVKHSYKTYNSTELLHSPAVAVQNTMKYPVLPLNTFLVC